MATSPFTWLNNTGGKSSSAKAKGDEAVAAALAARALTPATDLGSGLGVLGNAIGHKNLSGDITASEDAGGAAYNEKFAALGADPSREALIGMTSADWATPEQQAVVQALLGQDMQQSDPMYQMGLEKTRLELDALRNPQSAGPDYGFIELPDGSIVRTDKTSGEVQPLGKFGEGANPLVTVNTGGSDKFYDSMDAKLAEQQAMLIDAGRNAQTNNIRMGQLEQLLGNAPQGAQGQLVQVAGALGIPSEGLDDVQAAQALISQMVPGQRPPGSGTMSDADLALFKQSLPSIANQPGGNQKIIATAIAINEYTIAQVEIAQKVANREISPAEGRALQASVPNPLANIGATQTVPPGNAQIVDYTTYLGG